jgi:hypothetical protein
MPSTARAVTFQDDNIYWIGDEDEQRGAVTERLQKLGLESDKISRIIKQLATHSYPRQMMRLRRLLTQPFPAEINTCAFRETNIGGEKDLENSVLWKAGLSLRSITESLKEIARDINFEMVEMAVKYEQNERDKINAVLEFLREGVSALDLYHPIQITDACLWLVQDGKLQKIDWCRFVQTNAYGGGEWWFDVVNSNAFEKYASQMTRHYHQAFRKAKAKA